MALQKAPISVVLSGGLNTKVDPKLAVSGQLVGMDNVYQERDGELRIRNGCARLSTKIAGGGDITSGRKLTVFGDELLLTDADSVYSWSSASEQWVRKGSSSAFTVATSPVVANGYEQTNQDSAYVNGIGVYAWEDTRGGVRYSVVDSDTGQPVVSDVLIDAAGSRPRVVAIGNSVFIFYVTLGTTSLKVKKLRSSDPTSIAASATLVTDTNAADAYYDVLPNVTNGALLTAYRNTAGDITVMYVLQSSLQIAAPGISGLPPAVTSAIDCTRCLSWLTQDFASGNIFLATAGGTDGVQVTTFNSGLILVATQVVEAAVVTATQIAGYFDPSLLAKIVFYEVPSGTVINTKVRKGTVIGGSVTLADFQRSCGLASKVFTQGSKYYVNLAYQSTAQSTYFTLDTSNGEVVTRVLSTVGGGLVAKRSQLPGVWGVDSTKVLTSVQRKTRVLSENATLYTLRGINSLLLDYNDAKLGSYQRLGDSLHLTGGFLRAYDGQSIVEHGFHLFPEAPALVSSNAAGLLTNLGVYEYVIVYTWLDGKGQIHRSLASAPVSITMGAADDTVTLTIPTLRVTARKSPLAPIAIEVYRTENAGSIFYKITSSSAPTFNSTTADSVSFVDLLADTAIVSNEILYTNGGLLDNRPCPPCRALQVWGNRLWAVSSEDGSVWYSKKLIAGEAVGFAAEQTLLLEAGSGQANAIVEMDDKVLVMKRDEVFVAAGDGPNDTGTPPFAVPQRVTTAVGANNSESSVKTPLGIMFKSPKGFYLLDRGLNATYIGAEVQKYNDLTVTGAVIIDDLNQARFTTSDGRTLVYDWHYKQWSTFTNQAATDCTTWQGRFAYLSDAGLVSVENDGFSDAGTPIKPRIETSNLLMSTLLGFGRLYQAQFLLEGRATHELKVGLAYNYEEFTFDTHLKQSSFFPGIRTDIAEGFDYGGAASPFTGPMIYGAAGAYGSVSPYGGRASGVYQVVLKPTQQKCQTVRLIIEAEYPYDSSAGGTEAFRLSGFALLIGRKRGLMKLPTTNAADPGGAV